MPPIREIDLSDGIRIVGSSGLGTIQQSGAQIAVLPGNQTKKEERLNEWLQQQYESRFLLSEYDPDHRVRQTIPALHGWERIESDELVVITMYVAVHIFQLNPLRLTVRCQNKDAGPISGNWWE